MNMVLRQKRHVVARDVKTWKGTLAYFLSLICNICTAQWCSLMMPFRARSKAHIKMAFGWGQAARRLPYISFS